MLQCRTYGIGKTAVLFQNRPLELIAGPQCPVIGRCGYPLIGSGHIAEDPANCYVVMEWTPVADDNARREVNKRRRRCNISKTGCVPASDDATYF